LQNEFETSLLNLLVMKSTTKISFGNV